MKRIQQICRSVKKLTDNDFQVAEEFFSKQAHYIHPLKYAKANRMQILGRDNCRDNLRILASLKKLKHVIESTKP